MHSSTNKVLQTIEPVTSESHDTSKTFQQGGVFIPRVFVQLCRPHSQLFDHSEVSEGEGQGRAVYNRQKQPHGVQTEPEQQQQN